MGKFKDSMRAFLQCVFVEESRKISYMCDI